MARRHRGKRSGTFGACMRKQLKGKRGNMRQRMKRAHTACLPAMLRTLKRKHPAAFRNL